MDQKTNILFFGCWNRGFCSNLSLEPLIEDTEINDDSIKDTELKRGIELTQTMNILKEQVSELKNDENSECLIIVAGDNYYPLKTQKEGKKQKQIIKNSLLSGFNCLRDAVSNNKTLILLGNHDIDYINNSCDILHFQKQIVDDNSNFTLFNFESFDILKPIYDHTIIIMLDSTIFDDSEDSFECYKDLDGDGLNKTDDKQQIQNFEINKLNDKIKSIKDKLNQPQSNSIKNIVFMAHHPIYGLKESTKTDKDGKTKTNIKPDVIPKFVDFLYKEFIDFFRDKFKYYHLCADVHNYNHMLLTFPNGITIEQYIVGTGGAEKDIYTDFTYNSESINQKKNDTITGISIIDNDTFKLDIEYNIQDYTHDNGILNVTIISSITDISFKFIKNVLKKEKSISIPLTYENKLKRLSMSLKLKKLKKLKNSRRLQKSKSLRRLQTSRRSRKSNRIIPIIKIRSQSLRSIPSNNPINAKQLQNNILLSKSI